MVNIEYLSQLVTNPGLIEVGGKINKKLWVRISLRTCGPSHTDRDTH